MDRELNLDLPLLENITWQYDEAPSLVSLVTSKEAWYDAEWKAFWQAWYTSIFNLPTANRFGCVVWAIILDIPVSTVYTGNLPALPFGFGAFRNNFKDSNYYLGSFQYPQLSLDDARRLLRVRYWAQTISPTISNVNLMLKDVFGELGLAYLEETLGGSKTNPFGFGAFRQNFAAPDNFNSDPAIVNIMPMQQRYIFKFGLSPNLVAALDTYLPRGSAVMSYIVIENDQYVVVQPTPIPLVYKTDWQGQQLLYATPRTNLATFSEAIDNAAWAKTAVTVTPNAAIAPDGTTTADLVVPTVASVNHIVNNTVVGITAGSQYMFSIMAKSGGYNQIRLRCADNIALIVDVVIDLNTGTLVAGSAAVIIEPMPNGYWRISLPATLNGSATSASLGAWVYSGGTAVFAGDGVSGVYVWGCEVKPQTLANTTSYIKTVAAAVAITDYSATPTDVTLSTPLATGASLAWTGDYISQVTGSLVSQTKYPMGSGDGLTSNYRFTGIPF